MQSRPGVISFIGFILVLQAAFTGVAGMVLIVLQNDAGVQESTGAVASELVIAGIILIVLAAVQLLIAIGLLRGSRVSRAIVAIIQVAHVMSASWLMFTHHSGAFLYSGLITVAIAIFVLWALYNDRADAYYNAVEQDAALRQS